jgi:predicted TIM-barrel fold metal-dependent hydrolase
VEGKAVNPMKMGSMVGNWKLRKSAMAVGISAAGVCFLLGTQFLSARQAKFMARKSPVTEPIPALTPWADAHAHFDEKDVERGIHSALSAMGRENAAMIFLLMSPDTFDHPGHYEAEIVLPEAKKYPGKIAVVGGGGSLNALIMQSARTGDAGPAVRKRFKEKAEELLREGVAGFGEMTAEHFDGNTPYQYAPADHQLFLLLADIAAEHGVPIDLHMEAVTQDMPLPPDQKSPPNPARLHANIAAFERLLAHNPRAKIIWAHAGFDNTGYRTVELDRRLLAAHANLYMELKADPLAKGLNYLLDADGKIKPDWLALIMEYPERFVIGSDQHYPEPHDAVQRWQEVVSLLNQIPVGVREKIGTGNIAHIYGISVGAALPAAGN